ncbi:MAG: hypothetical protein C0501_11040 [Isosphaera sp.]|nr:hypothetical protein [Isosphaera sp.]
MLRQLFALGAVFAAAGLAAAQPDPKKPADLVTKVYDLRPILGEKGRANGIPDVDAVVKVILESVAVGELKPGTDGPQLVERDGGRLEVRAAAKVQGEVADLIEALRRLADVAIDVTVEVAEFDAAGFEAFAKALPKEGKGKPGSPILYAEADDAAVEKQIAAVMAVKAGRAVQRSDGRFVNGAEGAFSARQAVRTYQPGPGPVAAKERAGPPQFVKEGFKLVGLPVVSADRRFVRLKLTEQSAVVTGVTERELGEVGGQKVVARSPAVDDLGAAGSAVVADGGLVVFRLAYAPKDKVWVVALRPTIFIQSEEDIRKADGKK